MKKKQLVFGMMIGWLALIGVGITVLTHYETTPAHIASAPKHWPSHSPLKLGAKHATMVMILHPHCPCSRASLNELNRLLTQAAHIPLTVYLLFYQPSQFEAGWKKTDLWQLAHQLKQARIIEDVDGHLAKDFRAETSGQTLLYNASGHLLFEGGITPARGHEGDNIGHNTIATLLNKGSAAQQTAMVFGCPIISPTR